MGDLTLSVLERADPERTERDRQPGQAYTGYDEADGVREERG